MQEGAGLWEGCVCMGATKHLQKDSISARQTEGELLHQGAGALTDSMAKGANICLPY